MKKEITKEAVQLVVILIIGLAISILCAVGVLICTLLIWNVPGLIFYKSVIFKIIWMLSVVMATSVLISCAVCIDLFRKGYCDYRGA